MNQKRNSMKHTKHIELLFSSFEKYGSSHFNDWRLEFVNIHGELDTQRKIKISQLETLYNIKLKDREDVFKLIYCLETYYTIVLRLLAYRVVFGQKPITNEVFGSEYHKQKGILNYSCSELYDWFLDVPKIQCTYSELIKEIGAKYLDNIGIDFIKEIFESIFPSQVRHSMGEFYTPDWLAEFVITKVVEGDKDADVKKYLDPSCGSGTFIFNVIKKFANAGDSIILDNVYGIDINPVSVLAAKTNYLLLYNIYRDFGNKNLEIPIYHADTISSPFPSLELFEINNSADYDDLSIPRVDYIVGNPPWVNWEYLPNDYRAKTIDKWKYYSLFRANGMEAGFIKEDISVLLTYVALDKYLKDKGKLGFVVKETLFKSIKQGEGFRQFYIVPSRTPLHPYRVDDLTAFRPFNGAVNRSALLFIQKGEQVKYPVDYYYWKPKFKKKTFSNDLLLNQINDYFNFVLKKAKPSEKNNLLSGWITVTPDLIDKIDLVLGENDYKARTGVFTGGANGIYWLEVKKANGCLMEVSNIIAKAKNKVKKVHRQVEKKFIYPFLTGSELGFWTYNYSKYIILPHTNKTKMYPVSEEELTAFPNTMGYFEEFKDELKQRKGFTSFDKHIHNKHYYALQRIGEYTFAPYKVAWRYISKRFTPAVIEYVNDDFLGQRNVIPNEKIIFVGLENATEAYYLCGLLSSSLYRQAIESYMVDTQITPSIINRLFIPKFSDIEMAHIRISQLCNSGHQIGNAKERNELLEEIDSIVEEMVSTPEYIAMHALP